MRGNEFPRSCDDVFVSHASHDRAVADHVVAALEGAGLVCRIADRNGIASRPWYAQIVDAISSSHLFFLICSAQAGSSPEVKKELAIAVEQRRKGCSRAASTNLC